MSDTSEYQRDLELGRLLLEALEKTPSEWEEFLKSECDDASLVQEALELLRNEDNMESLMEQPAGEILRFTHSEMEAERGPGTAEAQPEKIGPYTVVRSLGEGGMGQVFLAEQTEPVERQVALKLALRSTAAGQEIRQRFLLERKTLGRLAHPNIARLYEAGTTEDGRPFVAMELVQGSSITDYCNRRLLSIDDRLRLFVEVCRGAQYAHQKQILHRDLKPANILVEEVDGKPLPKIIDFGIAKDLDRHFNQTFITGNQLIGTPHYMSPEALEPETRDDLDTRADVYSLGVVLYELITGVRPFKTPPNNLPGLLREITVEKVPRPSTRLGGLERQERYRLASDRRCDPDSHLANLTGDLDWIVAKAMAFDRDDRYGSAAELADELERMLGHLPVLARPPSRIYRAKKTIRRHRLAVLLGTATAAGLVLATVLTSFALLHAREAEEQSRRDAEISDSSLEFVVDLFEAARPDEATDEEVTANDLLVEGVRRLRDAKLQPLARARLLDTLGDVHSRLGLYPQARDLLAESLEIRRRELPAKAPETLSSLERLGNLERRSGRPEVAEPLLLEVLEAAEDPLLIANAYNSLGNLRWSQNRLDEAEELHQSALALRTEHLGPDHPDVAASHNNLGVLNYAARRYPEALPHLRRATELLESQHGPRHPRVADALGNMGITLQMLDQFAESEKVQRRALEIRRQTLGPEHPSTATSLHNLAFAIVNAGRYAEATQHLVQALEIRQRSLGEDHLETAKTHYNLGINFWRLQRYDEAEEYLRQAVEIRRLRATSEDNPGINRSRAALATVWGDSGRLTEARRELESVLASQRRSMDGGHQDIARTLYRLGTVAVLGERLDDAKALFEEALEMLRALPNANRTFFAECLFAMAELCQSQGKRDCAEKYHREAYELRLGLPERHPHRTRSEAIVASWGL